MVEEIVSTSVQILDREDGELSDEGGEGRGRLKAGAGQIREQESTQSVSTETEIDRILKEVEGYNLPPPPPPPPLSRNPPRNMLDPQYLQNMHSNESMISEPDEAERLRHAALVSMQRNGPEEGELRDEQQRMRSPQERPRFNDRLQVSNFNNDHRRYSYNNYNSYNRRKEWNTHPDYDCFRKRGRNKHRSPSPEKLKMRKRTNQLSESYERRRTKELREDRDRRRDDDLQTASFTSIIGESTPQETSNYTRNRRFRSDIEQEMIIFGEEMPVESPINVQQNEQQNTNMEVDSEEHSSPVSPDRTRQSIEDESALRSLLMEQINSKKVVVEQNDTRCNPTTQTTTDESEAEYTKNKKELNECELKMTHQQNITQKLFKQKRSLMKELEETMTKLADSQAEYWKARGRRDTLRPLVEKYEDEIMLKIADNDILGNFFQSIEENSMKINAMAIDVKARLKCASIPNSPAEPASIQRNVVIEHGEQDMDLSLTPVYTPEEENELQLRQILLEKQKNKGTADRSSKNNSLNNSVVLNTAQEATTTIPTETVPLVVNQNSFQKDSFQPQSPQRIEPIVTLSTPGAEEQSSEQIMRIINESGIPVRLLPHAGIELPSHFQIVWTVCPFEFNGRCKDVGCMHRHLNDDALNPREVASMIAVCFKQTLIPGYKQKDHKSQIDYLLSLQKEGERLRNFTKRIMKPVVEESKLLDSGLFKLIECN